MIHTDRISSILTPRPLTVVGDVLLPVVALWCILGAMCLAMTGCDGPINSPYPASQSDEEIYYTYYREPPKHFDPARSYSEDEYKVMMRVMEMPVRYHYLKRPYELEPGLAEEVPDPQYFDKDGNELPGDPPAENVARTVYTFKVKQGVMYQPHPCFAKNEDGSIVYADLTDSDIADIFDIADFKHTGTRELLAADFVVQLKRLCDPRTECPIFGTMKAYIEGMDACRAAIEEQLESIRQKRMDEQGDDYNQKLDERDNPIVLDYATIPHAGVRVIDDHTYQLELSQKYPQMVAWMALPFFTAVPQEAVAFYEQGPLKRVDITLDRYPVGTGPYRIETFQPNREIILVKNENFRDVSYPSEGEEGDREKGLLDDAGKRLPMNDKVILKLEKETLPQWNKFLQGYYDGAVIGEENFDQAIAVTPQGQDLTPQMQDKGIKVDSQIRTSIRYIAFNMLDPVVGGYDEKSRKLRQAISIALSNEEWITIFENGNGVPSHGPIPPGIFGFVDNEAGQYNEYVYNWNEKQGRPERKSITEAKKLLAEAGYPNGIGPDGKQVRVALTNAYSTARDKAKPPWMKARLAQIGIHLVDDYSDYSTFRDKVLNGNYQLVYWGWNADYPDPENFMFLFYGPNGKKEFQGENAANYQNEEFDELYDKMRAMTNSDERRVIIDKMTDMVQRDAPWVFIYNEAQYDMTHQWIGNFKPHLMDRYQYEYRSVDLELRNEKRAVWNQTHWVPLLLIIGLFLILAIPAVMVTQRSR